MTKTPTLEERLDAAPLTRAEIAGQIGVSRATLYRWGQANQVLKVRYVAALAELLGCSAGELLGAGS